MSNITQPEDHQPKKPTSYTFTDADGKKHKLPLASVGRDRLTGRDMRDAAVGGEVGQLAYLFKTLEAAEPHPDTLDALYAMPQSDMLDVLTAWGEFGDGDGASLGKSKRSSS